MFHKPVSIILHTLLHVKKTLQFVPCSSTPLTGLNSIPRCNNYYHHGSSKTFQTRWGKQFYHNFLPHDCHFTMSQTTSVCRHDDQFILFCLIYDVMEKRQGMPLILFLQLRIPRLRLAKQKTLTEPL